MAPIQKLKTLPASVNTLITNLKSLMQDQQVNEAELARQTNIPQPTLHKILTGKTADPRISTVRLLAEYFGITVDELHTGIKTSGYTQTHSAAQVIPIISWGDCLKGQRFLKSLTPERWHQWQVIEYLTEQAYGLISKPCMEPRFPANTILIVDPEAKPKDGDYVVVHYPNTEEATLREFSVDGPSKLFLPLNPNVPIDNVQDTHIKILAVVIQSRFIH